MDARLVGESQRGPVGVIAVVQVDLVPASNPLHGFFKRDGRRIEAAGGMGAETGDPRVTPVVFRAEELEARLVSRCALRPGEEIRGPAIVTEYSATTWCPPAWTLRLHESGALWLAR